MITMKDIYKDLISEASNTYTWLDNISDECKEFLSQLSVHIKAGNKANAKATRNTRTRVRSKG